MDQLRFVETQYRLEHRHNDGSYAPMQEQPLHHGAAEHDPERQWGRGRIFRCTTCDEAVTLLPADEPGAARR